MIPILLNTKDLVIGHKKALCTPINIEAYQGESICLLGRNGAGKSTFLNTLANIQKPLSGEIFLESKQISKINNKLLPSILSFVPSKQEYYSNLKVIDIVGMGRSPYTNIFDKKTKKDLDIIQKCIFDFKLEHIQEKHLYEVSDGERQKAMICRAFAQETPIILLDEPTAFLDYFARHKLLEDLQKLSTSKNRCIIFSCHDLDIALKYSNKAWLIDNNQLLSYSLKNTTDSKVLKEKLNI